MELLKKNEMKKFAKKFGTITKQVSNKTAKTQAKRETKYQAEKEEMDKTVRGVERRRGGTLAPKGGTRNRT